MAEVRFLARSFSAFKGTYSELCLCFMAENGEAQSVSPVLRHPACWLPVPLGGPPEGLSFLPSETPPSAHLLQKPRRRSHWCCLAVAGSSCGLRQAQSETLLSLAAAAQPVSAASGM